MNVIGYICICIYQHFFSKLGHIFQLLCPLSTLTSCFELVFDFKSSLQCLSVLIIGSTELKKTEYVLRNLVNLDTFFSHLSLAYSKKFLEFQPDKSAELGLKKPKIVKVTLSERTSVAMCWFT